MSRRQSFMPFGPPGCRPLPPKRRTLSPPPLGSLPPRPTHLRSRSSGPPLSESWPPGVPPPWSWPPSPLSPEFWPQHPPSSRSWTQGPPPLGSWPPCPPPPPLGKWPPCPPPPGLWPPGPPPMGSWSQRPPPMGSWPTDPPSLESWSPCPPYLGSWQLGPPSLGSWPPCTPPPKNWLHGAPPPSSMPSGSSSGPPCHDFMPSGSRLGSIPLIRPPETIQPAPKLDEKAKPSTKPGNNDKPKPYDSEEVKSTSKPGDSSNFGKQPASTEPPKLTLNLDDKAKPLTKHGSNDNTKRDAFDEVKPPKKSMDYSNLGTPLVNTGPLKHVQMPDVQENLSTTPGENAKTEYPTKHGVSFEVKPPTTLGDSSNSGKSPASVNPLEPKPNLEDKGKPPIKHGGIDETKYSTKRDVFAEVKPITKPGESSTSGMPAANIDISKLASKQNDKEKNSAELGGNDETNLGGSDEVKPPTKTGGYDNSGMLPTNTDPSKLAPKPYNKEKSLTILDGNNETKSSTMHGGSSEMKSLTNLGSKDETKPPTKLGGSDQTKPLHWFLIRKSTQGKQ